MHATTTLVNSMVTNSMDECVRCQVDGAFHKKRCGQLPKIESRSSLHKCAIQENPKIARIYLPQVLLPRIISRNRKATKYKSMLSHMCDSPCATRLPIISSTITPNKIYIHAKSKR
jgi:hypothetical protein